MGFLSRLNADLEQRYPSTPKKKVSQETGPAPPGGFSLGTGLFGGPLYTDNYGGRRAPSPWQLIEKYKSMVYAMASRNEKAVCRVPFRLYSDSSKTNGGKARSACNPCGVSRSMTRRFIERGLISRGSVDNVEEIRTHPFLDLLDAPDPYGYFNRTALLSLVTRYNDIVGGAWLNPEGPGWGKDARKSGAKGPPEYLWVLYSQYVTPERMGRSPLVRSWQYFDRKIAFEDTIWFRQTISLRDPYGSGYSPAYASDMHSDLIDKFMSMEDQILGLGPMPRVIFTAKDPMMSPGRDEALGLKQDLKRQQSGGNAGGVYVNAAGWEVTAPNYPPVDMSGVELTTRELHWMAAIFDQPATYYTVDTNINNLQAADAQHAKMGVEPRCKMIGDVFTQFIRRYDPRLFFAPDPALAEDDEANQKVVDMQLKSGQITINQANEETQWPPVEWGDEPWLPGTLKQPTMLEQSHQMEQSTGAAAIENEGKATEFRYGEGAEDVQDEEVAQRSGVGVQRFGAQGNPYHDDQGHFTGAGGHTGKHAARNRRRRERRKARHKGQIAEFRKDVHGRSKELKAKHREERRELTKGQRADWADKQKEHRQAKADFKSDAKDEHKELTKTHKDEHKESVRDLKAQHKDELSNLKEEHKDHVAELKEDNKRWHDDQDDDEQRASVKAESKQQMDDLKAEHAKSLADTKTRHENEHKEGKKQLDEQHAYERKELKESHREGYKALKQEHKDEMGDLKQEHKDARKQYKADERDERRELVNDVKSERKDQFGHLGSKKNPRQKPDSGERSASLEELAQELRNVLAEIAS